MAQLIATNQLTLTNVIDGKTSYHHWAYSDNADGTGLTLTDNGQRYMGYYTDYTQADSTDKTKYRWADRLAQADPSDRNLTLDTAYKKNPLGWVRDGVSYEISGNYLKLTLIDLNGLKRIYKNEPFTITLSAGDWINVSYEAYASRNGIRFRAQTFDTPQIQWKTLTTTPTIYDSAFKLGESRRLSLFIDGNIGDVVYIRFIKTRKGQVMTPWTPAPEDVEDQINSKADQNKVVYKTDISVTNEGIVHSASKTVNGQTIASMIAQRAEWVEIIARLLKVKGDMIVDGTIGANKLSVNTLSTLTADLGQISGGSLELLKSQAQANSVDAWGNFTIPAHKWGLYIDNIGVISSGIPVRKSSRESTASDMPVAVLSSGQLRFARVDQNNDLASVLHYGLSDPDNATISFVVQRDGTKTLFIQANGQIINQGTNYTDWNSTGVAGVYYKRQGDVVALKLQVATTANQQFGLGKIPVSLLPIQNAGTMMRVTAWTAEQMFGRNLQIDSDGSMVLLASNRGDTFNTQVTWII